MPASVTQGSGKTAITVTAVLARKLNHICDQSFFVFSAPWNASLCCAMLSEHATGPAFENTQLVTNSIDTLPTTDARSWLVSPDSLRQNELV
jgi:hypothetical protein